MAEDTKTNAEIVMNKLKQKATVTEADLEQLQQHIDVLESAAAGSHHHDHDSRLAEAEMPAISANTGRSGT
jgi:hypothetical protein